MEILENLITNEVAKQKWNIIIQMIQLRFGWNTFPIVNLI